MEEIGGFLLDDGLDDVRRLRGFLASLDELRIAEDEAESAAQGAEI